MLLSCFLFLFLGQVIASTVFPIPATVRDRNGNIKPVTLTFNITTKVATTADDLKCVTVAITVPEHIWKGADKLNQLILQPVELCPKINGYPTVVTSAGIACVDYTHQLDYRVVYESFPTSSNSWYGTCQDISEKCLGSAEVCPLYSPFQIQASCCQQRISALDRGIIYRNNTNFCAMDEIAVAGGGSCGAVLNIRGGSFPATAQALFNTGINFNGNDSAPSFWESMCRDPRYTNQQDVQPVINPAVLCAPRAVGCAPSDDHMTDPSFSLSNGVMCDRSPMVLNANVPLDNYLYFLCVDNVDHKNDRFVAHSANWECPVYYCPLNVSDLHNYVSISSPNPQHLPYSFPSNSSYPAQTTFSIECNPGYSMQNDGKRQTTWEYYCDAVSGVWLDNRFKWSVDNSHQLQDCRPDACDEALHDPNGTFFPTNRGVTNQVLTLVCQPGFYASPEPLTTCLSSGTHSSTPRCIPLGNVLAESRFYEYTLRWNPPTFAEEYYIENYLMMYTLLFPTGQATLSTSQSLANGVTPSYTTPAIIPGTASSYVIITDTNKDIEHVISDVVLTVIVRNRKNPDFVYSATFPPLHVVQPCGCTVGNPLGKTLNMTILQDTSSSNSLTLKFKPDSLCANQYRLNGPVEMMDSPVQYVDSFDVHSEISCPFLTTVFHTISPVDYRLHGRSVQYCLSPIPKRICDDCVDTYGVGNDTAPTPPVCINNTASFVVTVSGKITTSPSSDDVFIAGVAGVNVTAKLVHMDDINKPLLINGQEIKASVMTDELGYYRVQINSKLVTADHDTTRFRVLIIPTKVDILPPGFAQMMATRFPELVAITSEPVNPFHNTSRVVTYKLRNSTHYAHVSPQAHILLRHVNLRDNNLPHQIAVTNDPLQFNFTQLVQHASDLTNINFYDHSEATLTGMVKLPKRDEIGVDYRAFGDCPISNIVVNVYDATDLAMSRPIRTATTNNKGFYITNVPWFAQVTVAAKTTKKGYTHSFEPETFTTYVNAPHMEHSSQPFVDITTNNITLNIGGGVERITIGDVKPRLYIDVCGEAADLYTVLGPVSNGPVTFYNVPAQSFSLVLQHSDYQDTRSGLQLIIDPVTKKELYGPGAKDPSAQERFRLTRDYLKNELSVERPSVDLTDPSKNFTSDYTVIRPPVVQLQMNQQCRDTSVADPTKQAYWTARTGSIVALGFKLYAEYGTTFPVNGNQIEDNIIVIDEVSNSGTMLIQKGCDGVEAPGPCTVLAGYDPEFKVTKSSYRLLIGDLELSDHGHITPAYSRKIQYRLASQAGLPQELYVVITGTLAFGGSSQITFAPSQPQYVLRDPPGGASTASLTVGTVMTIEASLTNTDVWGVAGENENNFVSESKPMKCIGIGVMICENFLAASSLAKLANSHQRAATSSSSRKTSATYTLTQTVTTPSDPNMIDGDGDMFMTISGNAAVKDGTTIEVTVVDNVCYPNKTELTPVLTIDPSATLQWVTRWDINNVIIPELRHSLHTIYTQHNISLPTSFKDLRSLAELANKWHTQQQQRNTLPSSMLISNETLKYAVSNTTSARNWEIVLENDDLLKKNAPAWNVLLRSLTPPAHAPDPRNGGLGNHKDMRDNPIAEELFIGDVNNEFTKSQSELNRDEMIEVEDNNPNVGSLTFYGGSHTQSFGWEVQSQESTSKDEEINREHSLSISTDFEITVLGQGVEINVKGDTNWGITASMSSESALALTNSMEVTLADPDQGDEFKIGIYRDTKFFSPVYRILGGQSRCKHEGGDAMVDRDLVGMTLDNIDFRHVSIHDLVHTTLRISNQSPRKEEFTYSLTLAMESNENGLLVKVDGHLLSSLGTPLQFTVPHDKEVSAFVEIERAPGGAYNFTDVTLVLTGVPGGGESGSCASRQVKLNIQYDEPCVNIRLTDPSERFTNNEDDKVNGHYSQNIEIHNPEGLDRTRSWRTRYESGPNALKIQIQYRRVGTEEDFRAVTGSSDQINKTVTSAPYTSSYFVYTWDLDDVAEGIYEIRAIAQCLVPPGAADKSAYFHESNTIIGHIDHFDPEVFGSPLPVANVNAPFYPGGEPFQVDFNEPITCDSKFRDPNHDSKPKATAVFWNQNQQRQSVDLQAQCNPTATSLLLAFQRQHLKLVAGRQVNVTVENIVDLADNQMKVNPTWSFTVANLDSVPSPTNNPPTNNAQCTYFMPPANVWLSTQYFDEASWLGTRTVPFLVVDLDIKKDFAQASLDCLVSVRFTIKVDDGKEYTLQVARDHIIEHLRTGRVGGGSLNLNTVASNLKTGYLSVRSPVPTWLIVDAGTTCLSSVSTTFYNSIHPDVIASGDQIQLQSTGQYKDVVLNSNNLNQLKTLTLVKSKVSGKSTNDNSMSQSTSLSSLPAANTIPNDSRANQWLLVVLVGTAIMVLVIVVFIIAFVRYRQRKVTEVSQVAVAHEQQPVDNNINV